MRPEMIGQHVYESVAFGYLSVSSAVLGRAVLDEGIGLVWSVMYDDDLETAGIGSHEIEGLIDDLRIAREAGCGCPPQTGRRRFQGESAFARCGRCRCHCGGGRRGWPPQCRRIHIACRSDGDDRRYPGLAPWLRAFSWWTSQRGRRRTIS